MKKMMCGLILSILTACGGDSAVKSLVEQINQGTSASGHTGVFHELNVDGQELSGVYAAVSLGKDASGVAVYQLRFSDKGDGYYQACEEKNIQLGSYSDLDKALWLNVKEQVGEQSFHFNGGFNSLNTGYYTEKPFLAVYSVAGSYEVYSSNDYQIKGRIKHDAADVSFKLKGDFIAYKCGVEAAKALIDSVNLNFPDKIIMKDSSGEIGEVRFTVEHDYSSRVLLKSVTTNSFFENDWNFNDEEWSLRAGKLTTSCKNEEGYYKTYLASFNPDKVEFDLGALNCRDKYSKALKALSIEKSQSGQFYMKAVGRSGKVYTAFW